MPIHPFPSACSAHDLDCARRFAENARAQLAEAYKLLRKDSTLSVAAETAGKAARRLAESTAARLAPPPQGKINRAEGV